MGRRRTIVGSWVAVVILLVADLVGLGLVGDERPSATAVVRRSTEFLRTARSVSFTARSRFGGGEGGGVGRLRSTGVLRFPNRYRVTERTAGSVIEVIKAGDELHVREAPTDAELGQEKWAVLDPDQADRRSGVVRPDEPPATGDGPTVPTELLRVIRAARRPRLVGRTSSTSSITADVDVGRAFGGPGGGISGATLEVTASDKGRVDAMAVRLRGDGFNVFVSYTLEGWNEPVEIAAPVQADLDPTPNLDEEDLAAFAEAPLLQPLGIPEGWVLDGAFVLEPADTLENCRQVEVDYTDPNDDEGGYLTLFQLSAACPGLDREVPDGAYPLRAGAVSGYITSDPDEGVYAQLTAGRTVVQAQTDLLPADLATILGRLAPLDLARKPAPIPGIGRQRAAA